MTARTAISATLLGPALLLAACSQSAPADSVEVSPHAAAAAPQARQSAAAPAAARELPGPTDRDPTDALAFWREAMERRDWTAARRVFGNSGEDSGMTPQEFAAAWDQYRTLEVTVGDGRQEGAAGSSFYEVPVTIAGLTQDGKPYRLAGQLTLRRVNDVPGASAEQLRWHIERATLRS